jgi:predicted lactoylglutathione lyase/ABC-type transporter Mla MlaB component
MGVTTPKTIRFRIQGPLARSDLPGLRDRVCALLGESRPEVAICDVSGVRVDGVAVEALARLQLAARRHGCRIRLCSASPELLALVEFMGLSDVLPCDDPGPRPSGGASMASNGHRKIFVNLAVEDLDRSVDFFKQLGFDFDPRFTDETATCMIVSDEAFVMLLVRDRFKDFTKKELADPAAQTEAIMALSADSREQVDELAEKALAAGVSPANDPIEMDFMYSRSFQDPDGHLWELVWMDMSAVEAQA